MAPQLPNADNKEVSVTDKGEIRRRDDYEEKWDSRALGQINQRSPWIGRAAAEEVAGRDGLTWKRGKEPMSFRYQQPVLQRGTVDFHSSLRLDKRDKRRAESQTAAGCQSAGDQWTQTPSAMAVRRVESWNFQLSFACYWICAADPLLVRS